MTKQKGTCVMNGKILVAVDGSEHMARTLKKAIESARKDEAELIIVHVNTPHFLTKEELDYAEKRCGEKFRHLVGGDYLPAFPTDDKSERKYIGDYEKARAIFQKVYGEDIIKQAVEQAENAGLPAIRSVLKEGDVAKVVLDVAKKEDVDLIIVGRRGHSRIVEFFLGSIAQKIHQHADRSVLTVE
jgi:nucleotide-binding universal stress UspA family protein